MSKRSIAVLAALSLVAASFAAPALAEKGDRDGEHGRGGGKGRPAQTKMRFKLDDHSVGTGEAASGQVTLLVRDGKRFAPLEGATLLVSYMGEDAEPSDCGSVTTDVEGHATASCMAPDGQYVMRVVYEGDDTHKRSKRAQGFTVGAADDDEEGEDDTPSPDTTPEPVPSPTV